MQKLERILSGSLKEPYIIAELSANHGGDIEVAKSLILSAKKVGASAVKLQTFTADSITVNARDKNYSIPSSSPLWAGNNLYDLMKAAETPLEWHSELFEFSRALNLEVFSTAYDIYAVDFLLDLGMTGIKISSFDLINYPLLNYLAHTDALVLISTGMGTVSEIDRATQIFAHRKNQVGFLQCTSSYPCEYKDVNMNRHQSLKSYGFITGYSDHTPTSIAAIMAIAHGALIFEKHICLDGLSSLDSEFSINEKEFKSYIDDIGYAFNALGDSEFSPTESESASLWERPSVIAIANIEQGEVLTPHNVGIRRPNIGSKPEMLYIFINSRANRFIKAGEGIFKELLT
jgi:sialic acid synthase SpsE